MSGEVQDDRWNWAIDRILNSRQVASGAPEVLEALWGFMDGELSADEFQAVLS